MSRFRGGNLARAGSASLWMLAGRGLGLGWTAAIIAVLGIADYGLYAIGFAVAALIAAPLDSAFVVRSLRVDDERFLAERSARVLLGALLLLPGVALYAAQVALGLDTAVWVAGFALVVAGGEILFNAFKSVPMRAGHPDIVQRIDVVRQFVSIASGVLCLALVPDAPLQLVAACYLAPYLVVLVATLATALRIAPRLPSPPREVAMLWLEAIGTVGYLQGDILLLGLLAGPVAAGIYSVVSVICLAAASLSQQYAQTFHESLRAASGLLSAGPSRRSVLRLSAVLGALVAAGGLVVLVAGGDRQLAVALLVASLFVGLRCVTTVLQTALYLQGSDERRVIGMLGAAVLKLGLVAALFSLGAIGAAIACVLAEAVLLAWYARASQPAPMISLDTPSPITTIVSKGRRP